LPFVVNEDQVRKAFADCGDIKSVRWVEKNGEFKGTAFLDFEDTESTDKAIEKAQQGLRVGGRAVNVDYAAKRAF
jgi:nucleolin